MIEAEFGVSSMTARRDLAILEKEGYLRRTRGGAMLPMRVGQEDSFQHRLEQAADAKRRLAAAAVEMLADGDSVFIDSSTTAYHAARLIVEEGRKATILTNSIPAMDVFKSRHAHNAELIGIGGSLRKLTLSFVGPNAVSSISEHFADKVFMSIKGLAPGGYLTDPDALEAEVKRTMIKRAGRSVLLLDGSKFGERGLSVIAHLSEVTTLLATDAPEKELRAAASFGVEVIDV